jgi:hypothetical protein
VDQETPDVIDRIMADRPLLSDRAGHADDEIEARVGAVQPEFPGEPGLVVVRVHSAGEPERHPAELPTTPFPCSPRESRKPCSSPWSTSCG